MRWLAVIVLLASCAVERDGPCADCTAQGVHPPGYATADGHGRDIERRGWDFALCKGCHGDDFAGKGTAPSCLSCHAKPPTACDTCHEALPTTAAHRAHGDAGVTCSGCHLVPASWEQHRSATTGQPLLTFGALATSRGASPTWDGARCTNVYCHGGTLGDGASTNTQPLWAGGAAQAACGTCHGKPPANHAQSDCASCHPAGKHIDASVDLNGGGACNGCHGDAQSPAPTTGAHRAHLAGGFFSAPLPCTECHRVPAEVGDAGHIDSPLPAELLFGQLASARGATPSWDGARCTVYCHGASTPSWTGTGATDAYCGSCHGLPPATAAHTGAMKLTDCATCHPSSVGPFGNVLVGNGTHMNGVVDAN